MNYLDVYKRRIGHLGTNPQDRAYQSGILEFRRYLKYNQHTEHNLTINDQETKFSGVILTDKEDENRVSQILLTKVVEDGGPTIKQGDLIWWGEDQQPWIVYRSTTSSYQPHQKFYMVRCNYFINWVTQDGLLANSWIYLLGSKDSKIKDNFRTWHSVITPQPNKYISVMMPHQMMALGTEIIVLDEVWSLVEYDQSSVPGIIFLSFTETNLNEQRDSVESKIANIDKLANWSIEMPNNQIVAPNTIIDLNYAITKNGVAQDVVPEIIIDGNLELLDDNKVKIGESGGGSITISYNGVIKTQNIVVGGTPAIKPIFNGDLKIRVASTNNYVLDNIENDTVEFILNDPKKLVTMHINNNNSCTIVANDKNKLGTFDLTAIHNGQQFTKNISVVSIWQVI